MPDRKGVNKQIGSERALNGAWDCTVQEEDRKVKRALTALVGESRAVQLLLEHFPEGTCSSYLRGHREMSRQPITRETLNEIATKLSKGSFTREKYSIPMLRVF